MIKSSHAAAFPPDGKILLVDDDFFASKTITTKLSEFGFEIDFVESATSAIRKLITQHYDLVIMDVEMPLTNGVQAGRIINQLGLPVLYLSGHPYSKIHQYMSFSGSYSSYMNKNEIDDESDVRCRIDAAYARYHASEKHEYKWQVALDRDLSILSCGIYPAKAIFEELPEDLIRMNISNLRPKELSSSLKSNAWREKLNDEPAYVMNPMSKNGFEFTFNAREIRVREKRFGIFLELSFEPTIANQNRFHELFQSDWSDFLELTQVNHLESSTQRSTAEAYQHLIGLETNIKEIAEFVATVDDVECINKEKVAVVELMSTVTQKKHCRSFPLYRLEEVDAAQVGGKFLYTVFEVGPSIVSRISKVKSDPQQGISNLLNEVQRSKKKWRFEK